MIDATAKLSLVMLLRKSFEGDRLKVYDDATGKPIGPGSTLRGHPTIGTGRCLDMQGISQAEDDALAMADVQRIITYCDAQPWFPGLSDNRQRVIIIMIFQLGVAGFQEFHNLIAALASSDWNRAHDAMVNSLWDRETPYRASDLANAMLNDAALT